MNNLLPLIGNKVGERTEFKSWMFKNVNICASLDHLQSLNDLPSAIRNSSALMYADDIK